MNERSDTYYKIEFIVEEDKRLYIIYYNDEGKEVDKHEIETHDIEPSFQEVIISHLAKQLDVLNKEIVKIEEQGFVNTTLRKKLINIDNVLKDIIADAGPLDTIRDPEVREILKKIRDGNYYTVHRTRKVWNDILKKYGPEVFEALFREKSGGYESTEEEIENYLNETTAQFRQDIETKIDIFDYFQRKQRFGTIVTANKLPEGIHKYFPDIRDCFFFGKFYAAIGLCRVILEIAFKEKYARIVPQVKLLDDYLFRDIVYPVCEHLNKKYLAKKARVLYRQSSEILHGGRPLIPIEEDTVLSFIQETIDIIEQLYG